MMSECRRRTKRITNENGGRSRLWYLLPAGCLVLVAAPFAVSWTALYFLRPDPPPSQVEALDWEEEIGTLSASGQVPETLQLASPVGSFTLPQVLSVQDALEGDSLWVLLDARSGRLHFIHPRQGWLRSSGRKGEGPGELLDPVALAFSGSSLWVLNQRGLTLDQFTLDGTFQQRRRLRGGACLAGMARGLDGLEDGGLLLLRVCPATLPGPGTAWLEILAPTGELTPLLSLPLGTPGSRRLHLLRQPVMASDGRRVHLGTLDMPCLVDLTVAGSRAGHRCLPDYSRAPAPEEDREKLERRFRGLPSMGFLPMEVPDRLPWYDRLFALPEGVGVLRIEGYETRELVYLGDDGEAGILNARLPANTYVGRTTILLAEDRIQGSWIQIHSNPWK
jgi:hypothetical protein